MQTLTVVAARSRAHGAEPARWHAVEVHRPVDDLDGACELTLCGTLARVTADEQWPLADACPDCVAATR